jgi:hypothetical protein
MISNRKRLLLAFEIIALLSGPSALLLGTMGLAGAIAPQLLSVLVLPEMLLMFAVFFVMIGLVVEYTRLTRAQQSLWKRSRGVEWKEVQALIAWCPAWLKYTVPVLIVVAIVTLYPGGKVSWALGDPFEARHLGLVTGPALFILLSLPVIASARRMPGSYAEVLKTGLIA